MNTIPLRLRIAVPHNLRDLVEFWAVIVDIKTGNEIARLWNYKFAPLKKAINKAATNLPDEYKIYFYISYYNSEDVCNLKSFEQLKHFNDFKVYIRQTPRTATGDNLEKKLVHYRNIAVERKYKRSDKRWTKAHI